MNEREPIDVLKCVTVTFALVQNLIIRVKRIATGPLATHQISAQSVQPGVIALKLSFRDTESGAHLHVRMCARADVPHP